MGSTGSWRGDKGPGRGDTGPGRGDTGPWRGDTVPGGEIQAPGGEIQAPGGEIPCRAGRYRPLAGRYSAGRGESVSKWTVVAGVGVEDIIWCGGRPLGAGMTPHFLYSIASANDPRLSWAWGRGGRCRMGAWVLLWCPLQLSWV